MNKKILVVDDDPSILDLMTFSLNRVGHEVAAVGTGEEALKKMRSWMPDLVLLDIMLSGMHGFEVCQAIRSDRRLKKIPVIFISAKSYPSDIKTSKKLGAVDFLVKPVPAEDLVAAVDRAFLNRAADQVGHQGAGDGHENSQS